MSGVLAITPSTMPAATPSADRTIADRFRLASGLQPVAPPAAVWVYDPSAPFATRSGLLAAPNVDLIMQSREQFFGNYGLAFNCPLMHLYSRTARSLVDLLA